MLFKSSLCLAAAATASALAPSGIPNFEQFAIDSGLALNGLSSIALLNAFTNFKGTCNAKNVKIRQEWYALAA